MENSSRSTLVQVRSLARESANLSNQLYLLDANPEADWMAETSNLENLKSDINQIGRELQSLQANRSLMSPAELQAIDKALPLFQDAAASTQQAIQYLNAHQSEFWTPANLGFAKRVQNDTSQAAATLGEYIEYAKVRNKEQRLGKALNIQTGD